MTEPGAWDRLPEESNRWFMRFERFRLAGPGRTLIAIYNADRVAAGREESLKVSGRWRKVAQLNRWVERAEAWDQAEHDRFEAEVQAKRAEREAEWEDVIIGPLEVKGRLSEEAQARVHEFFLVNEFGRVVGFDMEKFRTHGHMVKKMTQKSNAYGTEYSLEIHDGRNALVQMGRTYGIFLDKTALTDPTGTKALSWKDFINQDDEPDENSESPEENE